MEKVSLVVSCGATIILSAADVDRVKERRWVFWGRYLYCCRGLQQYLHSFIIGPRPSDVPEDFVIDHANRDILDVSRDNLRYVPVDFNLWNKACKREGSYRGVAYHAHSGKWSALFRRQHSRMFDDPRSAFMAYASAVVQTWPDLASTSDLLVGEGLLSREEMASIQATPIVYRRQRKLALPKGVRVAGNKFGAMYRGKSLGLFLTAEAAGEAYRQACERRMQDEWAQHVSIAIPTNADGHAEVQLHGGAVTLVPPELYHLLTFRKSWCLSLGYAKGSWNGNNTQLHQMVYQLMHPTHIPQPGITIDHINNDRLDNTASNLRTATWSQQHRNKRKRTGTTSQHIGVSRTRDGKWRAEFIYQMHRHLVGCFDGEEEALDALTRKKHEVIGSG